MGLHSLVLVLEGWGYWQWPALADRLNPVFISPLASL